MLIPSAWLWYQHGHETWVFLTSSASLAFWCNKLPLSHSSLYSTMGADPTHASPQVQKAFQMVCTLFDNVFMLSKPLIIIPGLETFMQSAVPIMDSRTSWCRCHVVFCIGARCSHRSWNSFLSGQRCLSADSLLCLDFGGCHVERQPNAAGLESDRCSKRVCTSNHEPLLHTQLHPSSPEPDDQRYGDWSLDWGVRHWVHPTVGSDGIRITSYSIPASKDSPI